MQESQGGIGKWIAWIVILGLIVWGLSSFMKKSSAVVETGPIKIGASLPLSGEVASYGEYTKTGIDLAVKEVNDAGGINGRMLQVIYEDDKCSKDGVNTFSKLVNLDKVTAIVGPVCSPAAVPGAPIAQKAGVPTIIWASAPGIPKMVGDYVFRTYPSDSLQGKFAAEFAYNTLGKRKVSIIYANNEWGNGLHDVFSKRFKELGGNIVSDEAVNSDSKDLRSVVAKAKLANPDMIYYPMFPATGVIGLKEMKQTGIKVTVLGADALEADEVTKVPESEGLLLTFGKFNDIQAFRDRVKTATGKDVNPFTPVAYDSVKILASVMKEVGTNQAAVRDALAKISYTGGESLSKIEFDQDRDLSTGLTEIRIVKNHKSQVYTQ